jgi:hypothetical protein
MSDADLLEPTSTADAPPSDQGSTETAPELNRNATGTVSVDDDAAIDAALEENAIEIPDGDKLVPLSAVTTVRGKLKDTRAERDTYKQQAERASQLERDLQAAQQRLNDALPGAQAYAALLAAQQAQPQHQQEPAEDTGELEDIARDLDLYKTDGTPDIDKARKIHARQVRVAESVARQQVAPFENHSIATASRTMFARAALTEVHGVKADPEVLQTVWAQLDPRLTATEAGAKQALLAAIGHSVAMGKAVVKGTAPEKKTPELPDPLLTERAGGRDLPGGITLTDGDRRVARDMNMTDKEYAAEAAKMPWRK